MRRVVTIVLLLTFVALLAACAPPEPTPTPPPPTATPVPPTPTPEPPPAPNYDHTDYGISLWIPDGWVENEEGFEVFDMFAFGSDAQAVAWDESSLTHTAGGGVFQDLAAGARVRVDTAPEKDAPDLTPEGYVGGVSSQIDAFEKDVEVGEIAATTIGGEPGALVSWEGVRTGAELPVRSELAAVRVNGWDYYIQFDCAPAEWEAFQDTWRKMLGSVAFSAPQR